MRALNSKLRSFAPDFILCPDNFLPALALRKPPRAKLLWIAHHNYRRFEGNPIASNYSWIDLQLAHRLERRALRKADAIVAVSEYMRDVTARTLEPSQPMTVIHNHVDAERIDQHSTRDLRSRLGLTDTMPLIYMPSAGSAVKGERYAFEIIRRLGSGGRAAFFLSGNLSAQLEFELQHLAPEYRIHAPGVQSYEKNLVDAAACDVTVSPALIENLSSAFIESLALGVPVVAFDVGGNREIIQTGLNGSLTPYLDIESLISATQNLLGDRDALAMLQRNARTSIQEILNADRVLSQYNSVFASITPGA